MPMQNVPPVPYQTAMVDDKQLPSTQWSAWFRQMALANSILNVTGTRSSPTLITASVGVPVSSKDTRQLIRIQGSAGAVTISASPAIAAGSFDGQELILEGCDDTKTVTINNGSGTEQSAASAVTLGKGDKIYYVWNAGAALWTEISRVNV